MKKVIFPQSEAKRALSLLGSGEKYEVLAQAALKENDLAAFVLGRFGWSWGHFYRVAFCSVSRSGENEVTLEISHLNVQRPWHGVNFFRRIDSKIEDEIADYALANIHGAKVADAGQGTGETG